MITAVAFVPQAPALHPAIGRGLDAELGPVREACRAALRRAAAPGRPIVVLGADDHLAGYGPDVPDATIGEYLVRDALGDRAGRVRHVTPSELDQDAPGPDDVTLVVVGDGSACRSEKAPGYFDPRAGAVDATIATTLADGVGAALRGTLGEDDPALLVAGVDAWAAAAGHTEDAAWDADLLYDDAPFGVGYFVALWTRVPLDA